MSNTTSSPANRSTSNNQKPVVVNTPPWAPGSLGYQGSPTAPSALSPLLSGVATDTATRKAFSLPLISGKGKNTKVDRYLAIEATKKYDKNLYTLVNSNITLKNPYTGVVETYNGYFIPKPKTTNKDSGDKSGDSSNKPSKQIPEAAYPNKWKWNLPPHLWSRPVYSASVLDTGQGDLKSKPMPMDSYRRGRIWWKATPNLEVQDKNGVKSATSKSTLDRRYGFQFMWNPEAFSTSVAVNMDIYPSVQDRFIGVAGAFPATETISFNIRLDRTNDFACMAHLVPRFFSTVRVSNNEAPVNLFSNIGLLDDFVKYYKGFGNFADTEANMKRKIADLITRGTIADLEFLYKAINGEGISANQKWVNGRGIATADIGFLMPTLLHVDIGPLSYDGYVTALQVNHIAFSPEMIPIRTDVSISLNLLATAGITSQLGAQ